MLYNVTNWQVSPWCLCRYVWNVTKRAMLDIWACSLGTYTPLRDQGFSSPLRKRELDWCEQRICRGIGMRLTVDVVWLVKWAIRQWIWRAIESRGLMNPALTRDKVYIMCWSEPLSRCWTVRCQWDTKLGHRLDTPQKSIFVASSLMHALTDHIQKYFGASHSGMIHFIFIGRLDSWLAQFLDCQEPNRSHKAERKLIGTVDKEEFLAQNYWSKQLALVFWGTHAYRYFCLLLGGKCGSLDDCRF